ncbi:hypothetical protein [Bacteroides sp.]|uniref:hypothetical protein n=1 Tax=Bacteroides sp. TaxID=29523 RepID=UPI00261F2878|nr:hypothetical protein [Bacteroides sp.]MDD3039140.1 hypothetical protein [Bacteroides sp.]
MVHRTIYFILLAYFIGTSSVYAQEKVTTKQGPFVENDTTFLLKKYYSGFTQSIYIEKDKESRPYKRLLNFTMSNYDIDQYNELVEIYTKKNLGPLKTHNLFNLPGNWVPLYLYQGEYYLYSPSEGGLNGRRQINDSTLICNYIDGPYPYIINSVKQPSPAIYHISTLESYSNTDLLRKPSDLYIYMIDPVNEIAVWQYTANDGKPSYTLYVSENKARNFNMIVWNTPYEKEFDEFEFDQIDFKKLIEQCKNKQ